jgi:hypothetical protein
MWAPQVFLTYAALLPHADGTPAFEALVSSAQRVFDQEWALFGQINENTNGVLGVGSDSSRADSYYHWGALMAFVAARPSAAALALPAQLPSAPQHQ